MPTIRTLYKQGNSTVLAIPSYALEWLGVSAGDTVELHQEADHTFRVSRFSVDKPPSTSAEPRESTDPSG